MNEQEKTMNESQVKGKFARLKTINIRLKRERKEKEQEQESAQSPVPKPLPRGYKILEKYPLYEPFAHVAIAQNPKTGEYKYILDELQLDPLERSVYNRILQILIAEIESPKDEILDPRKFFV